MNENSVVTCWMLQLLQLGLICGGIGTGTGTGCIAEIVDCVGCVL